MHMRDVNARDGRPQIKSAGCFCGNSAAQANDLLVNEVKHLRYLADCFAADLDQAPRVPADVRLQFAREVA
jgi:hypothetical protein